MLAYEANEKEKEKFFTIIWGISSILLMLLYIVVFENYAFNIEIGNYIKKTFTLLFFCLFIWYHIRTKEDRFHITKIHEHIVLRYFTQRPQNDLSSYNLFGKVKSTMQTSCIQRWDRVFITNDCYEISISNFNNAGNLTVKYLYNSECIYNSRSLNSFAPDSKDGNIKVMKRYGYYFYFKIISLINKTIYLYDKSGNKIEENHYNSDGSILSKKIFTYNNKGKKNEEITIDSNDIRLKKCTFMYDSIGNMIKETHFDSENILIQENNFVFDVNGMLLEVNHYIHDGDCWHLKYDKKLQKIEDNHYLSSKLNVKSSEWHDCINCQLKIFSLEDGNIGWKLIYINKRKIFNARLFGTSNEIIELYNRKGKLLEAKSFSKEGILFQLGNKYDYFGNVVEIFSSIYSEAENQSNSLIHFYESSLLLEPTHNKYEYLFEFDDSFNWRERSLRINNGYAEFTIRQLEYY